MLRHKPLSKVRQFKERLARRKAVTIAIGAKFEGGVAVCADTKVVSTDGATHCGSKVFLGANPEKMAWAVANAADDGNAAKMLAGELSSAVSCAENYGDLLKRVKKSMTA